MLGNFLKNIFNEKPWLHKKISLYQKFLARKERLKSGLSYYQEVKLTQRPTGGLNNDHHIHVLVLAPVSVTFDSKRTWQM